jgi:hypothetical protein
MPYAYTQDVPIDAGVHQKIMDRLGPVPLEGLIVHLVTVRPNGQLRYTEVWESEAACTRAFEDRIHPAVFGVFSEIGFRPDREPETESLEVAYVGGPLGSAAQRA